MHGKVVYFLEQCSFFVENLWGMMAERDSSLLWKRGMAIFNISFFEDKIKNNKQSAQPCGKTENKNISQM